MPIPLTLRPPTPRNEKPLTAGLLLADQARRVIDPPGDPAIARLLGPARVTCSSGAQCEGAFAELDLDPDLLPADPKPIRYLLDCAAAELAEALALTAAAPILLAIEPDEHAGLAESAALAVESGFSVGLVSGRSDEEIADFLAVVTHSMAGFTLRARDSDDVVRLLAATVASMRGDDVRAALAAPDVAGLLDLNDEAAATVREILLGIEVADPVGVARELIARGLGTPAP